MAETDVKRDIHTEGTNLYTWFRDPTVAAPMVNAVDAAVPAGRRPLIVSVGASVGYLEGLIYDSLQAHGKNAQVVCADIIPDIYIMPNGYHNPALHPRLHYMIQNNRATAFPNGAIDVCIARSVLQYEPTVQGQKEVLQQIYHALKPGGCFVNQAPTFATGAERDLVNAIHRLLPKDVQGLTMEETYASMADVFDSIDIPLEQTTQPLRANRSTFTERYGPKPEHFGQDTQALAAARQRFDMICVQAIELIQAVPSHERPNVWYDEHGEFGFDIFYTIFQAYKR